MVGVLSASHDPSQLVIDHTARWTRVWKIGLPFALIVYGMAGSEIKGGVRHIPGWMIHLGNASYSIYLTHVLVLSAIGRCFALIPVHNFSIEGLFVLFCVIGTNGVGLLSYRLVERPTLRISRDLFSKAETRKQRVS